MILCKDCSNYTNPWCESPANGISPVNGKPKPMFASERRSADSYKIDITKCGPEAKNFIPKEKEKEKVGLWTKILAYLVG